MADVFISYCRSSGTSNLVRRIAQQLDSIGISCWYFERPYIGHIWETIREEIKKCRVFLLLLDEGALLSDYVQKEVSESFPLYQKQILPIPVKIGPNSLFNYLGDKGGPFHCLKDYNNLLYDSPANVPVEELVQQIDEFLMRSAVSIKEGKCGKNVTYTLYSTGKLVISGNGSMNNYENLQAAPWRRKRDEIFSVVIQRGVTSIGYGAFRRCKRLTSVSIPDSVKRINYGAFNACENLISICIPKSVTLIEECAFGDCKRLTSVSISNSVKSIKDYAFQHCESLTSVYIPDSVGSIGDYTFSGCESLTSVHIPASVQSIGAYAFCNCKNLESVNIPDSVTEIKDSAFQSCEKLTSVYIPDSVDSIGKYAFDGCTNLVNVSIPSSADIGFSAFDDERTSFVLRP